MNDLEYEKNEKKKEQYNMYEKVCEIISFVNEVGIKGVIPSIYLVADQGAGVTSFTQYYASAIQKYNTFKQRCRNSYIELEYKPHMSENDIKSFYQSINDAAVTCNRYYGIVVLYISEWKYSDMEASDDFLELLKYLECNKDNIRVIFVSGSQHMEVEQIYKLLKQYLNIYQVYLTYPDIDIMTQYVIQKLYTNGIAIDKDSELELKKYIMRIRKGKYFRGYHTLNTLIEGIGYYSCINNGNKSQALRVEQLSEIVPYIDKNEIQKIGF